MPLVPQFGYSAGESILSITYSPAKGIIAAGTDKGNVAMWKFMQHRVNHSEPESSWQLMQSKKLQALPIQRIRVGIYLELGLLSKSP